MVHRLTLWNSKQPAACPRGDRNPVRDTIPMQRWALRPRPVITESRPDDSQSRRCGRCCGRPAPRLVCDAMMIAQDIQTQPRGMTPTDGSRRASINECSRMPHRCVSIRQNQRMTTERPGGDPGACHHWISHPSLDTIGEHRMEPIPRGQKDSKESLQGSRRDHGGQRCRQRRMSHRHTR